MNKLQRFLMVTLTTLLFLALAQGVFAHPLGNFTVNRYGRISLYANQIHLHYIVDMAEIPAFQERQQVIDLNKDGEMSASETETYLQQTTTLLLDQLLLQVNGQLLPWKLESQTLTFPPGQGGLPTLRRVLLLTADLPATQTTWQGSYQDNNYAERLGWQEVVVQAADGVNLLRSSAPAQDVSQALQNYPQDLLQSPLAVNQATFQFETAVSTTQPVIETAVSPQTALSNRFSQDEFASLLTTTLEQPGAVALALLVAVGLGAAHALTPGHGKTIVGAYLVGSRGTARHALFLGLTTTITHTAGVFAFGLLVLFASQFILPEKLFPWLGVFSGLLVVGIGFSLFRQRLHQMKSQTRHSHEEGFHYHFGVGHSHTPTQETAVSWRNLLALGVSGGLIPCPSALVLLLSAIALNKVGFGLVLIVAFSLGLAGVLTGIGLVLVYANQLFQRMPASQGKITAVVPIFSALFITLAGLGITYQALVQTGIL